MKTIGVGKCQGLLVKHSIYYTGLGPIAILLLQTGTLSHLGLGFIAAIGSSVRWMMVNFCMIDDFVT